MSTNRAAILEKLIADRTAAESIYIVVSRSNPFQEYECDVRAGRCSCPAKRGSCWHLKVARWADQLNVPVSEIIRRLKRAEVRGWCAKATCRYCVGASVNGWICPASPEARVWLTATEANRQIEGQGF